MERLVRQRGRRWLLVCGAVVVYLGVVASCAWALPDGRGYELVSPVAKNGTGVVSDTQRTRASADGNALQFLSLGAFADAMGTGIATEYISQRAGTPGTPGWSTHAITPLQSGTVYDELAIAGFEPFYPGEFSPDLSTGVFFAQSPLTDDPGTATVPNLYVRRDLLTPGRGTYDLITHCPVCDATRTQLPPPTNATNAFTTPPVLAWNSPDFNHVAFQSDLSYTADTPTFLNRVETYESDNGTVTLAGRIPRGGATFCDDVNGPACVAAQSSYPGEGAFANRAADVVSDGSDGHTRVFVTFPTTNGLNANLAAGSSGQLYMRIDATSTVHINVSERTTADRFAPALFLDASTDGEHAFFMTTQALTNDAPVDATEKIYMYDATKPPSAPDHLTFINVDHEPGDGTSSQFAGIVGLSRDGHYVYFIITGQLVSGQELLGGTLGLYLWHDGAVRYIASLPDANIGPLITTGGITVTPRQARVSPDGRWVLYPRLTAPHVFQFYLYGADGGAPPVCVSCDPSGAVATNSATDVVRTNSSATTTSWHESHALSADGSHVFFSTAEPLVPEDVNGKVDVYEYDVASASVHLISTGTSPDDSWFMDASPDGSNVFFTTDQQLVGWDTDQEYDVYDARIGGGFPDPPLTTPGCAGDACQGTPAAPPGVQSGSSALFSGAGNSNGRLKPRVAPCRRGYVRKRVRGKLRCVKRPRPKRHAKARRARAKARRARAHTRAGHGRTP